MELIMKYSITVLLLFAIVVFSVRLPVRQVRASVQDEINVRQEQIEALQKQIDEYQLQIAETSGKAKTLSGEIVRLNASIKSIQLEITQLSLSIQKTDSEIGVTQTDIAKTIFDIEARKRALGESIRSLAAIDRQNLTQVLFAHDQISDFFNNVQSVNAAQATLRENIISLKDLKDELEQKEEQLRQKKSELQILKSFQLGQKTNLDQQKGYKDKLLKTTKGEEAKYQQLVKKNRQDIEAIRAQIGYLQQAGFTVEEVIKYGQLAAIRSGLRPGYLIAVLEQESKLGQNVGRCNRTGDPPEKSYRVIMKPERDHAPFLEITQQLGLPAETTAVSCPQYINGRQYGWGGAMGPAQFIPSTWMAYRDEVARVVGRLVANPWNIEDAFAAAAIKLARGGANAQTRAAEVAASKGYYSGNPKCSSAPCNNYANAIQSKAAIIEQNL